MKLDNEELDRIRERLTQEYYDRKLRRAEEVLPLIGYMAAACFMLMLATCVGQAL